MKSLALKTSAKEILTFAALLGGALFLFHLLTDPALAVSFIDSSDNPEIIADATMGASDAKALAKTMINYFLGFLGFIAVVMVIYAGVLYVTSAGNEDKVGQAKSILLYAAIGILLILFSYAFVNTIFGAASSMSGSTSVQ